MKNVIKKKGNEMSYLDDLLTTGFDEDNELINEEAMNAALEDMDEAEEEYVSETVASYMVYGGA